MGSTVFYTTLLLGVFVVYILDGPRATRITILTIAGVSAIVPIMAATLHLQARFSACVTKPFGIDDLLETVSQVLSETWPHIRGQYSRGLWS